MTTRTMTASAMARRSAIATASKSASLLQTARLSTACGAFAFASVFESAFASRCLSASSLSRLQLPPMLCLLASSQLVA